MKFKKEAHREFGKTLQDLRDSLLHLSVEFDNRHLKKSRPLNRYLKAMHLIDNLRDVMDDIECLEYGTIECYFVAGKHPYDDYTKFIDLCQKPRSDE